VKGWETDLWSLSFNVPLAALPVSRLPNMFEYLLENSTKHTPDPEGTADGMRTDFITGRYAVAFCLNLPH